ncbi:MAG: type II/IV secretion system protein, partial [Spirochaetaceae bacterium]|nr:type II/IV secretion system protein [Spirochaetaceae bacterium]
MSGDLRRACLRDFLPLPERQYSRRFMDRRRVILLAEDDRRAVIGAAREADLGESLPGLVERHRGKALEFVLLEPGELMEHLTRASSGSEEASAPVEGEGAIRIDALAEEAPAVNLVNSILLEAARLRASDVHLEASGAGAELRYRVDGQLRHAMSLGRDRAAAVLARVKLMANLNILERRLPQDGRLELRLGDSDLDVRVSVLPSVEGESMALRLFDRREEAIGLGEAGFSPEDLAAIRAFAEAKDGLVLAAGPTGSGKTTTIRALVRALDASSRKILAVEDPVETKIPGAVHVQVHDAIGLGFGEILKRAFRHDPDVLLVGEIRDPEGAGLALRAALTGHLVLTTLHANDAVSSFARLRNLGVEPYLLAAAFRGAIAQRLVRRLCTACAESGRPSRAESAFLAGHGLAAPPFLPRPRGCPACGGSGYRGRMAVAEVLGSGERLEALLAGSAGAAELRA